MKFLPFFGLWIAGATAFGANVSPVAHFTFAAGSPQSAPSQSAVVGDFMPSETMANSAKFIDTLVFVPGNATPDSADAAIEKNSYLSFTVGPNPGKSLALVALNLGFAFYGTGPVAGTAGFFVRSSLDDFSTDLGPVVADVTYQSVASQIAAGEEFPLPGFNGYTIDLSGPAFQKLTKPVEFRIYFFDTVRSPYRRLAFSDVSVTAKP